MNKAKRTKNLRISKAEDKALITEQAAKERERHNKIGEKFIRQFFSRPYLVRALYVHALTNTSIVQEVYGIKVEQYVPCSAEMRTLDHTKRRFYLKVFLDNTNCPCEDVILVEVTGTVPGETEYNIETKLIKGIS